MSSPVPTLSRAAVRDLDRRAIEEFGVPGVVLMENAGRGAAELLLSLGVQGRVVVCCGKGNNGGDGYVMARHLDLQSVDVRVWPCCHPNELAGDARTNHDILVKSQIPMVRDTNPVTIGQVLNGADWIVDALFGTGLQGSVRPPFDLAIRFINGSGRKVLAVDIPSGLDCDTGQPLGATVRATHTVTFVAMKKGFLEPGAEAWTGKVHVVGIGAPRELLKSMFVSPRERSRGETKISHLP